MFYFDIKVLLAVESPPFFLWFSSTSSGLSQI